MKYCVGDISVASLKILVLKVASAVGMGNQSCGTKVTNGTTQFLTMPSRDVLDYLQGGDTALLMEEVDTVNDCRSRYSEIPHLRARYPII